MRVSSGLKAHLAGTAVIASILCVQLASGQTPPPVAADDPVATLVKQLELVRGLSSRIEEAKLERNRRVEMLKTLALHLASLRARSKEQPAEVRSLSDRVRVLCDDISRRAVALDDLAPFDHGAKRP